HQTPGRRTDQSDARVGRQRLRKCEGRRMSAAASQSLTVHVSLAIRHRRGRKIIVTPAGVPAPAVPCTSRGDPTLVKALARAFRWKRLLENGTYASISEMAAAEKIDRGYAGRVLLLTLLAPDTVEAILDGRLPDL